MAKRKNIRVAGRLVSGVVYTATHPADGEQQRAAKTNVSSAARERMNLRYSWQKLELVLAANFKYSDLHVVLTYDDEHLPPNRAAAKKVLKKFIRAYREERKARGQPLRYVYNCEGNHGTKRLHHHMVINATGYDYKEIPKLWTYGNVNFEIIGKVGYTKLAQYLTKEPKDGIWAETGERSWTPSLGLKRPDEDKGYVPANYDLTVPAGAMVLLNEFRQNEFGEYHYIKYLLPEPKQDWPKRYHRCRQTS